MEGFAQAEAADPAIAKLYELIVAHATAKGGRTLEVWRLSMGRLFGDPVMMTTDEVAARLDLPVSEVTRVIEETNAAVRPLWTASQEFKRSPRYGA
jgi:hypothetical protein